VSIADVFISHAGQDKSVADAICFALEAQGVRCWIAPRDIRPGMAWPEAIIDAIEGTNIMVLVLSGHSNRSEQVMREVSEAVHHGSVVIPFRIEDVVPTKSLRYFLSTPHWLDAMTPPIEAHIQKLLGSVKSFLEKAAVSPPFVSPAKSPQKSTAKPLDIASEGMLDLDQLGGKVRQRGLFAWLSRLLEDR
jgi:hypothetical protein